jgi:small GTP-binding protein
MHIEDAKLTFRAVTIGDSSVGKTSIVNKFIRERFDPGEANTIGALYDAYTECVNGRSIEVQIWDTAGQEQYRSLTPVYFRSASAAILVFDVANRATFEHLDDWVGLFRTASSDRAILFLVGNKCDLADERAVKADEAREWAAKKHCPYLETSARSGSGVRDMFRIVASTLASNHLEEIDAHVAKQKPTAPVPRGPRSGCC